MSTTFMLPPAGQIGGVKPSVATIIIAVERRYSLVPGSLKGQRQMAQIASARHVACYLIRHMLGLSFPAIGRLVGGRHHSTVKHSVSVIEGKLSRDREVSALLLELTERILRGADKDVEKESAA